MNFYKPEMLVKSHLLQAIYFVKLVHINSLHIFKATGTSFIFEYIFINYHFNLYRYTFVFVALFTMIFTTVSIIFWVQAYLWKCKETIIPDHHEGVIS